MTRLDLKALVEEIGELFAPLMEDQGQRFEVRVPDEPVCIAGHDLLLKQAVGNLLHNAARYAGPGATVTLALEPGPKIVVADDGPGVPAEHLGRVQERFVRLDAARSTPGSGLGLSIAGAGAKLHGGRLVLEDARPGLRAVLELGA
jgi:hypothetical protein